MVDSTVIEALNRPMKFEERAGPGRKAYRYVKGEDVIERLNEAFSHEWSSEVVEEKVNENFIVLRIKLSVWIADGRVIYKEAYGGSSIMKSRSTGEVIDLSNSFKSAFTGALKKAAEQFGIALKEGGVATSSAPAPAKAKFKSNPAPETNKPDNTAVGSVVVATKKTEATSDDLEKAKEIMEKMSSAGPEVAAEKSTLTEEKKSPAFPTPEKNSTDIASDLQQTAIVKLAEVAGFSFAELLVMALEDKKLVEKMSPSFSTKTTVEELTKTEASCIIRFISNKSESN